MSSVNFLQKLLDGVGVEWKALKDIGIYVRGLVYNCCIPDDHMVAY